MNSSTKQQEEDGREGAESGSKSSLQRALEATAKKNDDDDDDDGTNDAADQASKPAVLPPSKPNHPPTIRLTLEDAKDHPCIIAIVGSVDFHNEDSPALCDAIGRELASSSSSRLVLHNSICLWTGANADIPKRLARAYYDQCCQGVQQQQQPQQEPAHVYHLAPAGYECDWDFGKIIQAGGDMSERRRLLATCATVVLSVEGGPGTADEMTQALRCGASVVPLVRSGGASAGMFGAPRDIPRPPNVPADDWDLLSDKQAPIQTCAEAVARILHQICRKQQVNKLTTSRRPTLPDGYDYVEPSLAQCAHLVFQGGASEANQLGDIFLGPKRAAEPHSRGELIRAGVKGIVNCTNRVRCHFRSDGIKYCVVSVNDEVGADILSFLEGATTFVHAILCDKQNVVVHCEMGVSRSATVVMAYLIRFHQRTREDAYIHVKKRRPRINPNQGFWHQLQKFEEQWYRRDRVVEGSTAVSYHSDVGEPDDNKEMDLKWCFTSCILFSTLNDLPHLLKDTDCFHFLTKQAIHLPEMKRFASVWLDFLWGRGLIVSDLEWLSHCCETVDNNVSSRTETHHLPSMKEVVISVLQDEDSDFVSSWSGEIYTSQIQKVVGILA